MQKMIFMEHKMETSEGQSLNDFDLEKAPDGYLYYDNDFTKCSKYKFITLGSKTHKCECGEMMTYQSVDKGEACMCPKHGEQCHYMKVHYKFDEELYFN